MPVKFSESLWSLRRKFISHYFWIVFGTFYIGRDTQGKKEGGGGGGGGGEVVF